MFTHPIIVDLPLTPLFYSKIKGFSEDCFIMNPLSYFIYSIKTNFIKALNLLPTLVSNKFWLLYIKIRNAKHFLIYFRKSSFHFSVSNEVSNFFLLNVNPSTVTTRTTYTFKQNLCSKIHCA